MPEIPDRREQFAQKYDDMEDEQLRDILRADASKSEGEESDVDEIFYVMELLAKRRAERGEARDPVKALEAFKKRFYPNGIVLDDEEETRSEKETPYSAPKRAAGWRRRLVAAAVAAALLAMGVVSAGAARFNLWETIARWTQETFHWGTVQDSVDHNPTNEKTFPCSDLQDVLLQYNITEKIVPTWFPEGFMMTDMRVVEQPEQRLFHAQFDNEGRSIMIQIHDYLDSNPHQFEQSSKDVQIYSKNGVQYYIFLNNETTQIVWTVNHFECEIGGAFSMDDAKKIIDSIEKG